MSDEKNFLARWARRKADVASAEAVAPVHADKRAEQTSPPAAASTDEETFDLSALPQLDDITSATDIRPFMHRLVPADLRNAVLRRMWELDPAIRDYVSPATEYAWNFNIEGGAPGYAPLESGLDAIRTAERMFSRPADDHTLVEASSEPSPALEPVADTDHDAAPQIGAVAAPHELKPMDSAPVRLSPKNQTPSESSEVSSETPAPSGAPATNDAASQPPRRRHGGALPS